MEQTTQLERGRALEYLAGAQRRLTRAEMVQRPCDVSIALTPPEVAALVDFAAEEE